MWTFPSLDSIWQDLTFAVRSLRKQPGFTAISVLVLAAVTGLNTSLFTAVNALTLHPPAGISKTSDIVALYPAVPMGEPPVFTVGEYRFLAGHARAIDAVAVSGAPSIQIGLNGVNGSARPFVASGNFFRTLGISLVRGRGFQQEEDRPDAPRAVVVLGSGVWEGRFGGDPDIVGRSILLDNVPFTVVGIASREFIGLEPSTTGAPGLFLPLAAIQLLRPDFAPASGLATIVGRLAPDATREQARAEADVLLSQFHRQAGTDARKTIVTGTAFLSHPGRSVILALFGLISIALMLVWLLGCANVGNLLLARAAARAQEIGIRLSLGASRARVIRQLLTEGFVLALVAGALGVGIAYALPSLVVRLAGDRAALDAVNFSLAPDGVVLVYALLLSGASCLAFGLAPALHVTRSEVASALRDRDGLLPSRFPLRSVLLGVQVATSVIVLVGAGLLVRRVQRQASFDPGIPLDGVSVVSFSVQGDPYDQARTKAFLADLAASLRQLPIGAFGLTTNEPFSQGNPEVFRLPGETSEQNKRINVVDVTPGYLDVLRVPIVAGRNFLELDTNRPVALINESMARRYWPNDDPIGKTFVAGQADTREIVGVVRDVSDGLEEVYPTFYRPFGSASATGAATGAARDIGAPGGRIRVVIGGGFSTLVLRSGRAGLADEIARAVAQVDSRVRPQMKLLSATLEERRKAFRTGPMLAGLLGVFALGLATVGMFGVFAYAVKQRTREIGIRMALGAQRADVVRLILAGHSRAVVVGLFAGLLGAIAASQVLRGFLYGLSPFDPIAYLGVAALLACAGLAASYVPARRATRIDPIAALRCD
jgi:predicted permease